jgi:RecB family exonuclease
MIGAGGLSISMDRSPEDYLGQEDHFSTYELDDHWSGEYYFRPKRRMVSWTRVSATQIENYRKCPRSWYFKSIVRVPETQRGSQALGTAFHLIMEKVPAGFGWPVRSDTNATPEEWDIACAMAKEALLLLPQDPKQLIKRECGITLDTYENGPQLIGYIDLAIPDGVGWPAFLVTQDEKIIGDYKTTSDFRYMKTPEELADNVQMMTYAKWALDHLSSKSQDILGLVPLEPKNVRLVHMYAKTRGKISRNSIRDSNAVVTPDQINAYWDKTLDTIREMEHVSTCGSHEDVEAKGALNGHCEAYGGCSFRDKCGISKESGIKGLFQISKKPTTQEESKDMSGSTVMQKILAARAAQGLASTTPTQTTSTPAVETVAPSQASASAKVESPAGQVPQGNAATVKPTGPISGMIAKISAANNGAKPTLAGGVAQAYCKEQGIDSSGPILGSGALAGTTVSSVGELVKLAAGAGVQATGVIPSDAPPREQPVITQPGQAVEEPELTMAGGVASEDSSEESEEETPNAVITGTTTITHIEVKDPDKFVTGLAEVVKRRGRPTREEMAAREAAEKAAFDALVDAEVQKRLSTNANTPIDLATMSIMSAENSVLTNQLSDVTKDRDYYKNLANAQAQGIAALPADQGCTLYVDCFPVKGQATGLVDFFEWIQPVAAAVAEGNGVKDWRLIQYTAKGLLANAIRELVKAEGLPSAMTIPSYAAGADVALEVLTPIAKRVIKKLS